MMTWFAVHALVSLKKDDASWPISVYENIFLVEAHDVEEARSEGARLAMIEVEVEDDLTVDGVHATRALIGIRKVVNVSNPESIDLDRDRPVSGTEITYSEYEIGSEEELRDLAEGKPVTLRYVD